jgi:endo-1,4-beta-mannosidase
MPCGDRFRLGVNYWPARTAMSWWSQFDPSEVATDFARIAACGLDCVRVFLTWEDFQPAADRVDQTLLDRLVEVADLAAGSRLALIPTLFTGHMSGVNWIPPWALGGSAGDARFRVIAAGRVANDGPKNWFTDPGVLDAQALLATEAVAALREHEAVWAWDLGNENSNCVIPPTTASAEAWLARTASAIRSADDRALVTIGLHMEDLEEDRRLGPREAAGWCDFLSMHGYPIYATWADGPLDTQLVPFLARVTRWLGNGRDVLFSEFGLPTRCGGGRTRPDARLVDEEAAAVYTAMTLEALRDAGCLGAMLWCYSDYRRARWSRPPLDRAHHERSFGLWRADGSPKPAVAAVADFAGATRCRAASDDSWIDIDPGAFLLDPGGQLPRLYERYRRRSR